VAPSDIVFSERGSKCEFSANQGISTCGAKPPVTSQNPKTTGISNAVSKVISSVIRPNFANTAPETAESELANHAWTPNAITPPSSFVQDYYNRTIRPLGLPGNGDVRLLFPLSIPTAISSVFGWRIHPITGNQRLHTGTDLAAPMGTPVLAALTGRVILAGSFGGYGISVGLEHSNGTQQTLYAHLSELFVRPGEVVTQGTVIGRVGSTGASTGPHLHFEFRQQTQEGTWVAQDPGLALEQAMAQLVQSMQVTQNPVPQQDWAN
jgi:murein DD-endopeptidase MepM/ murein hydrolase activator NlpD